MDATELSRRSVLWDGWFNPALAASLAEHGYLDELRRQAEREDWTCAEVLVEELTGQRQYDAALKVLAPYAATGWWPAVETVAETLNRAGRTDEAIELITPFTGTGDRDAVRCLARLLASGGRTGDVLALLGPRAVDDQYLAETLVDLTSGSGRDDEVLGYLASLPGSRGPSWNAAMLRATVLERQGRVDDAVALLRSHVEGKNHSSINDIEHLADLMARHGQLDQLREFTAGHGGEYAAYHLAGTLADHGEIDQALDTLGPFLASGSRYAVGRAAELLSEHGRGGEAIELLRPLVLSEGYDCGCAAGMLADLFIRQGRSDEMIALVGDLAAREGSMTTDLFTLRVRVLRQSGRSEQAIAEVRAHPEADEWYLVDVLGDLLAENGQVKEAIEVLRSVADGGADFRLTELLIQQGRVPEAVKVAQAPKPFLAPDRVHELKAALDRIAIFAGPEENDSPEYDEALREETVSAFIAGGAGLLKAATPRLWKYYHDVADEFTPEERVDYGIPEIPGSADIWEHVSFPHEVPAWHPGNSDAERGRSYLFFEGEVSWEPEHGLQLVFEDGRRVSKVGPFDGHLT